MQTTTINMRTGKTHHYYRCPRRVREGKAGCDNPKNVRADYAEPLVWEKVSALLKDPERLSVGPRGADRREGAHGSSANQRAREAWLDEAAGWPLSGPPTRTSRPQG